MKLMQRPGNTFTPEYIDNYIRLIKEHPGACDNVWLSTSYGFPPLAEHRRIADFWKDAAAKFRAAGVTFSLQISNTIGHGNSAAGANHGGLIFDGSPARNAVGPDGRACPYVWCWRDEYMINYVCEYLSYYAEMQPEAVWLDDDFRPSNHGETQLCCFCDHCIAAFNEKWGVSFSREELVELVLHDESTEWRERWRAFSRESAAAMIRRMFETIHRISPATIPALQHGTHGAYLDIGYTYILDAMREATGFAPMSRPGGGAYSDGDPNAFLHKAVEISWQNAALPSYVKVKCPEIENLPHVVYGKSSAGTAFETSLYFAAGSTDMSYSMMMQMPEPLEFYGETFRLFAKHRPYWEKLSAVNLDSHQGGLQVFSSRDSWKRRLTGGDIHADVAKMGSLAFAGAAVLQRDGIPLAYDRDDAMPVILHPDAAAVMSREEFEVLLTKNVVTCGESAAILLARGFDIGAAVQKIPDADFSLMTENYTAHPTKPAEDQHHSSYFTKGRPVIHLILPGEGVEPLSIYSKRGMNQTPYFDDPALPYGIASAIVTTPRGAKWFVDGYHLWKTVIPTYKRERLLNIVDYISEKALPARMITSLPVVLYPRVNAAGETAAVSVVNMTVGRSGPIAVRIRRPAGCFYTYMSQHNGAGECELRHDGDGVIAVIPDVDAYSAATIFVE